MRLFDGKWMSINVNLSQEQIEAIASLTADKVNQTRTYYSDENERLYDKIDELNRAIQRREELITTAALQYNSLHKALKRRNETIKKLKEELAELKNEEME